MKKFIVHIIFYLAVISCKHHAEDKVFEFNSFPDIKDEQLKIPNGPKWMHNAVFYQIYPQSFYDSNGDGIGDLKGIIFKLDYIKSLGVDAIWLNPFYESPFRDAGYDVTDYYKVAPRYGTNDDARRLFHEAEKKGLRIIVDFVPGHTSIDHQWFKASCSPIPNKYSNWYIWTNGTWFNGMEKYRENFIQGYCDRDGNFMINYFWHQPALNYGWGKPDSSQKWQLPIDHPDVMALKTEMKKVMRYWLDMGASGFRCDMAGSLVKNDPDKKIRLFWQDVRKMLDTDYPNAFIISEWSDPETALDGGFHADFFHWFPGYDKLWANQNSFFSAKGQGDISEFLKLYLKQYEATKGKGYISLPVGNHDISRINRDGRTIDDLKLIYIFQFTMPNIPFIYYGDEIGMRNMPGLLSKEGSYGRSAARTPMQWSKSKNLGFSSCDPTKLYLPVDSSNDAPTVDEQENDTTSLLNFVRKLIMFKKQHPALNGYSSFYPVYAKKYAYPFIFIRSCKQEKLLIILNPSNEDVSIELKGCLKTKPCLLFGKKFNFEHSKNSTRITIMKKSYAIYQI